jgi:hypothetical protein
MNAKNALLRETHEWATEVEQALRIYDDEARAADGQPWQRKMVSLPVKEKDLIRLLNWKVWTLRYGVCLQFIVDFVLKRHNRDRILVPGVSTLGMTAARLTSPAIREELEAEIKRVYPNGENRLALAQAQPEPLPAFGEGDDFTARYGAIMLERQRAYVTEKRERAYRR